MSNIHHYFAVVWDGNEWFIESDYQFSSDDISAAGIYDSDTGEFVDPLDYEPDHDEDVKAYKELLRILQKANRLVPATRMDV